MKQSLKRLIFGTRALQPFWKRLLDVSLAGLNIGTGGGSISDDGEAYTVRYVLSSEKDPIVFDVGAQGGEYTDEVLAAALGRPSVFAFEPSLRDFRALEGLFDDRVRLFNIAFGDSIERARLYPNGAQGLSSLYMRAGSADEGEDVSIETIDSFCEKNGVEEITLLKLDVEGHEFACLRGARRMLPSIRFIQFEMSAASRDARVYFRDIFEYLADYRIYRILRDGLAEVESPDKFSELLYTTNYLAIRKEAA
ncbi:MAG: FkbM family methyltransferase [Candidatus Paceibacterota bacterium]|jgi:FkbM family methyltransferase